MLTYKMVAHLGLRNGNMFLFIVSHFLANFDLCRCKCLKEITKIVQRCATLNEKPSDRVTMLPDRNGATRSDYDIY